jgi:hypothetical protein
VTPFPRTQRLAEYLIRRACRRLPDSIRDERYQEWTAELPAILCDPGTRYRAARALLYAADQTRGARRYPKPAAQPRKRTLAASITAIGKYSPAKDFGVAAATGCIAMALLALSSLTHTWFHWPLVVLALGATLFYLGMLLRAVRRSSQRSRDTPS